MGLVQIPNYNYVSVSLKAIVSTHTKVQNHNNSVVMYDGDLGFKNYRIAGFRNATI